MTRNKPTKKDETQENGEEEITQQVDETPPKGKLTLQNWTIQHNIPNINLAGFMAEEELKLTDIRTDKQFCDAYKKYLNKPGFIKP